MYNFKDFLLKEENIKRYCAVNKVSRVVAEVKYCKWKEAYLVTKVDISQPQNMVRRLDTGVLYENAEVAAKAIGSSPTSIRKCCNGTSKQHKGIIWQYVRKEKGMK